MRPRLRRKKEKKTEQKRISRSCTINDECKYWSTGLAEKGREKVIKKENCLRPILNQYQKTIKESAAIDKRLIALLIPYVKVDQGFRGLFNVKFWLWSWLNDELALSISDALPDLAIEHEKLANKLEEINFSFRESKFK